MSAAPRIEDHALIGDLRTAALVARDGTIDWFCPRRFDAPACFAALLGTSGNGQWRLAPREAGARVTRRYLPDTLVLETEFATPDGVATLTDFMPHDPPHDRTDIIRILRGVSGRVAMRTEVVLRFDYGSQVPWVRHEEDALRAVAGPDAVVLRSPVGLRGRDFRSRADVTVAAGEAIPFVLTCHPSHLPEPAALDAPGQLETTCAWWRDWAARCTHDGEWRDAVRRSLITLKALTYAPTGGIVAAPTTSLPEWPGGPRNWDYRYCWVRDATFTLYALLISGYREEAVAWREWLLRAVAGMPAQLQPLYGVAGERRLQETELPWLAGFADSRPVRTGNAAHGQTQLDIYGELLDAIHAARRHDISPLADAWQVECALVEFLETRWSKPDRGIWEIRGPERHFTHSKVMTWVAMDRAVKAVERFGLPGDPIRWAALRDRIHADVCRHGFDAERNTFVQSYGSHALDGALLMLPMVGFLPATDPRILGTVRAVRERLTVDGLIRRYEPDEGTDGLPGEEGVFLPCTFWLADNLAMTGQTMEAREVFERLLGLRNDLGLLAEEYDPVGRRQLGNFPQAFSHIALVNTAHNLTPRLGPAEHRAAG